MHSPCPPHMLILSVLLTLVVGCAMNPYTNRMQLLLISEEEEINMGRRAWAESLSRNITVSHDPAQVDPVRRIAKRIIEAAKQSKYAERAKAFEWDVNVIEADDIPNAWVLPGGKIAIYTGIFPIAKKESGLAAIIGHEVVHALARHGAERISQRTVSSVGVSLASAFLGMNPAAGQLANLALAGGVLLPFSRSHESEADYIGLLLAARAGYDPEEAIRVWRRMSHGSKGSRPEFLSTHPSHDTRIENLTEWMPEALAIYKQSQKAPDAALPPLGSP
ncbi:MAG: M48 family metallopeptidase [Nitrospira sp.]|nr:M48 family metallopeptidase [Nitrospira sp.]